MLALSKMVFNFSCFSSNRKLNFFFVVGYFINKFFINCYKIYVVFKCYDIKFKDLDDNNISNILQQLISNSLQDLIIMIYMPLISFQDVWFSWFLEFHNCSFKETLRIKVSHTKVIQYGWNL